MGLSRDDVEQILRIVDGAPVGELRVQTAGFSLHLLVGDQSTERRDTAQAPPEGDTHPAPAPAAPAPGPPPTPGPDAGTAQPASGGHPIPSPMLGTFYRAEAPGAAPFVAVGDTVEPDTIVCIIEVMKMMNSVAAGVGGTVVEVLAEDGALVEFGQPLFRVETPDA